ncbi:MAG: M18 family aminopeptidase [Magnetococcales bacterium]|nr:M18 family aminopeptidase [Magnetococcales bacterium]
MSDTTLRRIIAALNSAPTPYHAVATMVSTLVKKGFTELDEGDNWQLTAGGRYYVIRDFSSIIAFTVPEVGLADITPLRLVAAHTDSPALKIKPTPLKEKKKHLLWDVAVYGSPIISTWFDRDLSLAGLVGYTDGSDTIKYQLLDFKRPISRLANLAIHLNKETNKGYSPQLHDELNPFFSSEKTKNAPEKQFDKLLLDELVASGCGKGKAKNIDIMDWDLAFYDTQPAALCGFANEWLAGARLDNLLSCFSGLEALCEGGKNNTLSMLACFDHEEVGSQSATGAAGNFIESTLHRLLPNQETFSRSMAQSRMLSVDNAHAYHPNHPSRQDDNNSPTMGDGIVLKYNSNQRYTTNAISGSWLQGLCKKHGIPTQKFSVRADMPCGSTIGPILTANLGISAIDIGIPTWAMHSIRETAGSNDIKSLVELLTRFYDR